MFFPSFKQHLVVLIPFLNFLTAYAQNRFCYSLCFTSHAACVSGNVTMFFPFLKHHVVALFAKPPAQRAHRALAAIENDTQLRRYSATEAVDSGGAYEALRW